MNELFSIYNGIVSASDMSENDQNIETFLDEKKFLSSVKTHIGHKVLIEHDGKWRYTMICAVSSIHQIMKQMFELRNSNDFVSSHPGLKKVRNCIVNFNGDRRFTGKFTEEDIFENAAPKPLRSTISYLCYGVPDVDSFDILSISNSIYYNHRKRPDVLTVVSGRGKPTFWIVL